jgi:hypothetical protein
VLLTWAPSRGLVVSPSECAAACLKFRAAYSLLRSALSPRLLEVLLEASRTALNARPSTRPTIQASRAERWYGHQPYVGTFLHAPGELVEVPASDGSARTLGFYSCPDADSGHVVFDLELGARRVVPNVLGRASPFIVDTVRESKVTGMYFTATPALHWIRGNLGIPHWFGDDLGLAAPAWLEGRSLPNPPAAAEEAAIAIPTRHAVGSTRPPTPPRGAQGSVPSISVALGSRAWFWNLDPSQTISYAPNPASKHGQAKSRYAVYCPATTVGEYVRRHAEAVSGTAGRAVRADADFCYDFAHGLVRVMDLGPGPKTRIQMGDTRAQADKLSQGDGVPDLVDLVVPLPPGEVSLVIVSPSTLQAVSPVYPLASVGAVGGDGLAATIVIDTGTCASVLGSGRYTGAALGVQLRGASFAFPSGSGGEDPAGHLVVSEWEDTDDSATECVD